MSLYPHHDREMLLGFCNAFSKRASIGHVGMDTEPTPIQYWRRRFSSLTDSEQLKLASLASVLAPRMTKRASWFGSISRAGVRSADDLASATRSVMGAAPRTAATSAEDLARFGRYGTVGSEAGDVAEEALRAKILQGLPAPPVPPITSAPAAAAGAAGSAGAAATPAATNLPGWAQRAVDTYRKAPGWSKALTVAGIGYPVYQMAQGQIGPGEFAARVGGDVLTMGMGLPMQIAGGWLAPAAVGKFVDPALGWKPLEQRTQEAQLRGQQEALAAVQQQLAAQTPVGYPPPESGPQLSANGLAISGPSGTMLRPDLTMPYQMTQREAIRQQFPGL